MTMPIFFSDLATIQKQFHPLIRTICGYGKVIDNATQNGIKEILEIGPSTFALSFADINGYHTNCSITDNHFPVYWQQQLLGKVQWDLFAQYNQLNALATIAATKQIGIEEQISINLLHRFHNVKRRLQCKGEVAGITLYDDFAHHLAAISQTIKTLKSKQERLWSVISNYRTLIQYYEIGSDGTHIGFNITRCGFNFY